MTVVKNPALPGFFTLRIYAGSNLYRFLPNYPTHCLSSECHSLYLIQFNSENNSELNRFKSCLLHDDAIWLKKLRHAKSSKKISGQRP
ncbi:hypothetical protein [Paraburkholderia bonniea]|uniref:hypothetical protein n=1 Tax=Paraburkholderia bonniea TaxID=2152891 RepID=UPI001C2C5D7F|nr:hypothetical protein [Paraburkholderia bonniea]